MSAIGPAVFIFGRVAAVQHSPEEIIAELEKELDFTPLKLHFLANRNFLLDPQKTPQQRLQCVSEWMQMLHAQTTGQKKEAFYLHGGELMKTVCVLYPLWESVEERNQFSEMIQICLAGSHRISDQQLTQCIQHLVAHSKEGDAPILLRFLNLQSERLPPFTQELEQQLVTAILKLAPFKDDPGENFRGCLVPVSSQMLRQIIYQTYPLEAQFCVHSLNSNLPILERRINIFEMLNQYKPGEFADDIATHQASLQAWREGWADPPPPPRQSTPPVVGADRYSFPEPWPFCCCPPLRQRPTFDHHWPTSPPPPQSNDWGYGCS